MTDPNYHQFLKEAMKDVSYKEMSAEDAALNQSTEAKKGHNTGKGSFAAKSQKAASINEQDVIRH